MKAVLVSMFFGTGADFSCVYCIFMNCAPFVADNRFCCLRYHFIFIFYSDINIGAFCTTEDQSCFFVMSCIVLYLFVCT